MHPQGLGLAAKLKRLIIPAVLLLPAAGCMTVTTAAAATPSVTGHALIVTAD